MQLQGRNVLVTGATRGIGRELARGFAGAGSRVVLVGRDQSALDQVAAETGGIALPVDLADPQQVAALWARAEDAAGAVQVLVNNAGAAEACDFGDCDWGRLERMMQVDLLAPMRLCRDAVRSMGNSGEGHIVNVSSLAGVIPPPGLAAYSAAKAGLDQLTRALRIELAGLPIGTTLVEIGPVRTDMLSEVTQHEPTDLTFRRMYDLRLPVELSPVDVAHAIVAAVRQGRRHVRLPRRAAPLALMAQTPAAAAALTLVGVPRRARD